MPSPSGDPRRARASHPQPRPSARFLATSNRSTPRRLTTYGTDSGHQAKPGEEPPTFAANDEAFANFAHRAYKKVRDVAVAIMQRPYGSRPEKLYFVGSSEGGREGLTMAQRHPADFDGIFSRVLVINWAGLQHAGWRSGLATMGDGYLSDAHVKLVREAVLRTCDDADGTADGIVSNPVACKRAFDLNSLACAAGQRGDTCLTPAQLRAVETLHASFTFSAPLANGLDDYPGWGVSGEATPGFAATVAGVRGGLARRRRRIPPQPATASPGSMVAAVSGTFSRAIPTPTLRPMTRTNTCPAFARFRR